MMISSGSDEELLLWMIGSEGASRAPAPPLLSHRFDDYMMLMTMMMTKMTMMKIVMSLIDREQTNKKISEKSVGMAGLSLTLTENYPTVLSSC